MRQTGFILLIGNETELAALATGVSPMVSMARAYTGRQIHLLTDLSVLPFRAGTTDGVVIGPLFRRNAAPCPVTMFSDREQEHIVRSDGASLIEDFWGGYVAVWEDRGNGTVTVMRDPSGFQPCYYIEGGDPLIVASDLGCLTQSKLFEAHIDYGEVARHLAAPDLRRSRTCLSGLIELGRGFALVKRGERCRLSQRWRPWERAATSAAYETAEEAVEAVRAATRSVIAAWCGIHRNVVLGVSGGLDSSIIAHCAVSAGAKLTCLTLATEESTGDERYYARLLANALGVQLAEAILCPGDVDLERSDAFHLPRPIARSFAQSIDRHSLELRAAVGADAFYSGGGGDSVFCYQHSALPIADRLLTQGVGRGTWQTAVDVARMVEVSAPRAVGLGVRRAWCRPRRYPWRPKTSLLSEAAVGEGREAIRHPWLDAPPGALPGKAAHIAYLLKIENHIEGFGRERDYPVISPLMSQPLVEACLKVPTWFWCAGGRNRSIARQAFAADLPATIIERTTKGGPDGFVMQLHRRNKAKIAEMLLHGRLMEHGLVDRIAIEAALALDGDQHRGLHYRLLALIDVEAWIRAVR